MSSYGEVQGKEEGQRDLNFRPCLFPLCHTIGHGALRAFHLGTSPRNPGYRGFPQHIRRPLLTILSLRFIPWRQFYRVSAVICFVSGSLFPLFVGEVKITGKLKSYFGEIFRGSSLLWVLAGLWTIATGASMGYIR
jgi:hypothetical protein